MVDVKTVLEQLFSQNRVFCSEADFQFALAWQLRETYGQQVDIRLEYTPWKYPERIHIDIAVITGNEFIPIELKYRKAKLDALLENGEQIKLSPHTAHDTGAYEYLADIERLEKLMLSDKYPIKEAYAIMLTNDSAYWRDTRIKNRSKEPNDIAFRVYDGVELSGKREWNPVASKGTTKGHEQPICLLGKYKIAWHDCKPLALLGAKADANNKVHRNILFKYNIVKITRVGLGLHPYSKYVEQFQQRVAADAAMPAAYKNQPKVLMPDDDNDFVSEYFALKKSVYPYEHWNKPLDGKVYCRAKHQIVAFDSNVCKQCSLLSGSGQGDGVDCFFPDIPTPEDYCATPQNEYARISELIDKGILL